MWRVVGDLGSQGLAVVVQSPRPEENQIQNGDDVGQEGEPSSVNQDDKQRQTHRNNDVEPCERRSIGERPSGRGNTGVYRP